MQPAEAELVDRSAGASLTEVTTEGYTIKEEPFSAQGKHRDQAQAQTAFETAKASATKISQEAPPHEESVWWSYAVDTYDDEGNSLGMQIRSFFGKENEALNAKNDEDPVGGSAPVLSNPNSEPWSWSLSGTKEVPESGPRTVIGHEYTEKGWDGQTKITHDADEIAKRTSDALFRG